jgi:glycosyltransferase involved in cell wall biosynthesis
VVIIWQRFLPYHRARIRQAQLRLALLGHRLTAIEVASQDATYNFDRDDHKDNYEYICCFPDSSYNDHTAPEIHLTVRQVLMRLQPDVIFAPATPFPEGMAADVHRLTSNCRRIMMDDAWEHTDQRGWLTMAIKRLIHRNIDGVFIPAPSHLAYYVMMGFSRERVLYGVDVVDNEYFRHHADTARASAEAMRAERGLPEKYFLFVGRFLPRKGLEALVSAYSRYRTQAGVAAWSLVLVGGGPHLEQIQTMAGHEKGIHFAGVITGTELCYYYGLAQSLVVPSVLDPWGLVVNEGMAAALPVLVSRGCGAAETLVKEGENGWTFAPGNNDELAVLMTRISELTDSDLREMGKKSQTIIANWSLDRFADGIVEALNLSRREPGGMLADMATKIWKGRVSIN